MCGLYQAQKRPLGTPFSPILESCEAVRVSSSGLTVRGSHEGPPRFPSFDGETDRMKRFCLGFTLADTCAARPCAPAPATPYRCRIFARKMLPGGWPGNTPRVQPTM